MKKGDLRKQEILRTAEELFCKNGYVQTSVQDIINLLNTSKGSFYHHFASKEALLEGICCARASDIFSSASAEAENNQSLIRRLDILLTGVIPFRSEKLRFLLMLLPVFTLPEGRTVREYYCQALAEQFRPALSELIESGNSSGQLFCDDSENASWVILTIVNHLWVSICEMIIDSETRRVLPDLSGCLRITASCRQCIERYLSLPYGSICLIDIPALRLLAEQIHNHWDK